MKETSENQVSKVRDLVITWLSLGSLIFKYLFQVTFRSAKSWPGEMQTVVSVKRLTIEKNKKLINISSKKNS